MKKISFVIVALAAIFVLASCKNGAQSVAVDEYNSSASYLYSVGGTATITDTLAFKDTSSTTWLSTTRNIYSIDSKTRAYVSWNINSNRNYTTYTIRIDGLNETNNQYKAENTPADTSTESTGKYIIITLVEIDDEIYYESKNGAYVQITDVNPEADEIKLSYTDSYTEGTTYVETYNALYNFTLTKR